MLPFAMLRSVRAEAVKQGLWTHGYAQMDRFEGLLICTTNVVDRLDRQRCAAPSPEAFMCVLREELIPQGEGAGERMGSSAISLAPRRMGGAR